MQQNNAVLKSIIPIQIYKSTSAIYLTCLSKLSRTAFVPKCNQKLMVEKAIVQALDESIMPQSYASRQMEAEELLARSQTNFREIFDESSRTSSRKDVQATDETSVPHFNAPRQVEVEGLSASSQTSLREMFEEPQRAPPSKKVQWGQTSRRWINKENQVTPPINTRKQANYKRVYRKHKQRRFKARRGRDDSISPLEMMKLVILIVMLTGMVILMSDVR